MVLFFSWGFMLVASRRAFIWTLWRNDFFLSVKIDGVFSASGQLQPAVPALKDPGFDVVYAIYSHSILVTTTYA